MTPDINTLRAALAALELAAQGNVGFQAIPFPIETAAKTAIPPLKAMIERMELKAVREKTLDELVAESQRLGLYDSEPAPPDQPERVGDVEVWTGNKAIDAVKAFLESKTECAGRLDPDIDAVPLSYITEALWDYVQSLPAPFPAQPMSSQVDEDEIYKIMLDAYFPIKEPIVSSQNGSVTSSQLKWMAHESNTRRVLNAIRPHLQKRVSFARCCEAVRALEPGFDYDSTVGAATLVETVLTAAGIAYDDGDADA